jgi:hypothetical protein
MTSLRWVLAGSLVAVATCGGGGSISLQDLGTQAKAAVCAYEVRCGLFPDQASCVGSVVSNLGQLMADVNAGKIAYDGVAASECLNVLSTASCSLSGSANVDQHACKDAFKGTAAGGAPCYTGAECISQQCDVVNCMTSTMCCAGTCSAFVVAIAAGGACSIAAPGSACAAGTSCRAGANGAGATCQALIAVGGACADSSDCVAGAACKQDTPGHGTCQPYPREGQACDPNNGLPCDALSDTCDATTHTCVPLTAVGGACSVSGGGCVRYASCDPNSLKCVAKGGAGGPCTQDSCLGDLACVNAVCALPSAPPVCP